MSVAVQDGEECVDGAELDVVAAGEELWFNYENGLSELNESNRGKKSIVLPIELRKGCRMVSEAHCP